MSARRLGSFDLGEERSGVQQHEEVTRELRGTVNYRVPSELSAVPKPRPRPSATTGRRPQLVAGLTAVPPR